MSSRYTPQLPDGLENTDTRYAIARLVEELRRIATYIGGPTDLGDAPDGTSETPGLSIADLGDGGEPLENSLPWYDGDTLQWQRTFRMSGRMFDTNNELYLRDGADIILSGGNVGEAISLPTSAAIYWGEIGGFVNDGREFVYYSSTNPTYGTNEAVWAHNSASLSNDNMRFFKSIYINGTYSSPNSGSNGLYFGDNEDASVVYNHTSSELSVSWAGSEMLMTDATSGDRWSLTFNGVGAVASLAWVESASSATGGGYLDVNSELWAEGLIKAEDKLTVASTSALGGNLTVGSTTAGSGTIEMNATSGNIDADGAIDAGGGFSVGGSAGITQSLSVSDSNFNTILDLEIEGGIITAATTYY